jgi:hypothetical protein
VIPAKGEANVPRYVRNLYVKKMTDKIIYTKTDKAVIAENEKRMEKGFSKMDLHTEQPRMEGRLLKSLQGKREQIENILDRGVYREYGVGASNGGVRDANRGLIDLDEEVEGILEPQANKKAETTPLETADSGKTREEIIKKAKSEVKSVNK